MVKISKILILFFVFALSCKPTEVVKEMSYPSYKILDESQIIWVDYTFQDDNFRPLKQLRFCNHHPDIVAEIIF